MGEPEMRKVITGKLITVVSYCGTVMNFDLNIPLP